MSYIYVITNDINGKQYVGQTSGSLEKRFKQHINDMNKRSEEKRPLYSAMKKYGIEHFYITLIEECSYKEVDKKEIY
jgi:group I intron endonuclease